MSDWHLSEPDLCAQCGMTFPADQVCDPCQKTSMWRVFFAGVAAGLLLAVVASLTGMAWR
jgi:hypothetical protein